MAYLKKLLKNTLYLSTALLLMTNRTTWAALEPRAPFKPPTAEQMPTGPVGDSIRRGENILSHTKTALPDYVGNRLNCTSCHLDGGRTANAGPFVGIWGVFPEYRSRNAKVNELRDRVNDCFERSLNGKRLPTDSPALADILTYMWWVSRGVPTGVSVEGRGFKRVPAHTADAARGKQLYAQKCALCHGPNGEGTYGEHQEMLFPPVWGKDSFNIGAGLARLDTAAAFLKWNMPRNQGGTLTDQEAYDLAQYVTHQPRPDFAGKTHDWPKGDKPPDARY
jgi:thiosulfate dehydrogenase